jgi:hypothetical protein
LTIQVWDDLRRPWCADSTHGYDSVARTCRAVTTPIPNCVVHNITLASAVSNGCIYCAVNFKPSADNKSCIAAPTPVGAFMTTANDISYPSMGWSTVDGGKTFVRNSELSIDADCASTDDRKTCTSCNAFSGKILSGNTCVVPSISIPLLNIPADYSAFFCNTLSNSTCLRCSKDNRYCLACRTKVTSANCTGDNLGVNVIFATAS